MATVLAFDLGTKRIGVATGQTITGTANPLTVLKTRNSKPDWPAIEVLIETWQPDSLVVGLPLNMDGTEQTMTAASRRFCRQLEGRFRLPVHAVDERLSSVEARARRHASGASTRAVDAEAAQLILETWLAENP